MYFTGDSLQFRSGNVYDYSYTTSVSFNDIDEDATSEGNARKDVGVEISVDFSVTPLLSTSDSQFLKLQVGSDVQYLSMIHRL